MPTIYVTKYALSTGPFKVEAELNFECSMAVWSEGGYSNRVHGKDFWLTEIGALADCERRREDKLKSLAKQQDKIQKLVFSVK